MSKKHKENEEQCNCNEQCTCEECNCTEEDKCSDNCQCSSDNCKCGEECNCNEDKIKTLEESLLRTQAELINYKRRKDEETSRLLKYANEDIILDFLPILDNIERAIKMDDNNLDDEVSKFLEGFKMVYSQITSLLEKYEVREIDCLNKTFDPAYHQAVLTDKDETKESGIILEVLQKGYMYKDKVIRPSMVKVNE